MRVLILAPVLLALAACTQLNSLEITPDDNAMACLRGNTNAAGAVLGANVSVELRLRTSCLCGHL
jgi:hypothetical protein